MLCYHGLLLVFCLCISYFTSKTVALDPQGCDDDWFHFKEHCYKIVLKETTAQAARNECLSNDAELASVWSESEKQFIVSLWQFPRHMLGFLWTGLRGTPENGWEYDDLSPVVADSSGGWSLVDDVPGVPASTDNKCLALRQSSTVAFLDCQMDASAFACKKALPKLYITPGVTNRTHLPAAAFPLNHTQTFQRLYPPRLTSFPAIESRLAEVDVDDEVNCAYKCFSIHSCMLFQVTCHTQSRCASYKCLLFTHLSGFL